MRKRIFLGLPVSPELQEKIRAALTPFRKLPIRFVRPRNLHVTLLPPWYEEHPAEIIHKLSTWPAKFLSFPGQFERLEYGPNSRHPNLLWISGEALPELLKLRQDLAEFLGQPLERRPFLMHLTMARFPPEGRKSLPFSRFPLPFRWREIFRSIVLYESKLLPSGAEYTKLLEIPLAS